MTESSVLHVWDCAGVAACLAHHSGPHHSVIKRKILDPYGQISIYDAKWVTRASSARFYTMAAWRAMHASILHVHGGHRMLSRLRHIPLVGRKPHILHYHGTDVRANPPSDRATTERSASRVIVATPDLLDYEYARKPEWLPNPIDTTLFAPRRIPNNNLGLVNMLPGQTIEATLERLDNFGFGDIDWDFVQRHRDPNIKNPRKVMYANMPDHLAKYEWYCGLVREPANGKWPSADSRTALEAMSLGVKVIRHDGSVRDTLPPEHRVENVVAQLRAIYKSIA